MTDINKDLITEEMQDLADKIEEKSQKYSELHDEETELKDEYYEKFVDLFIEESGFDDLKWRLGVNSNNKPTLTAVGEKRFQEDIREVIDFASETKSAAFVPSIKSDGCSISIDEHDYFIKITTGKGESASALYDFIDKHDLRVDVSGIEDRIENMKETINTLEKIKKGVE